MDKTGVIRTPDQRVRVFISSTLTEITAPRRSCSPTAWPWLAARRTGSPSSSRCMTWRSAGRQGHRLAARLRAARPARRCGPGRAALPPGPCGIRGGPSMGPIRRKHARQRVRTAVRTTRPAQVVARLPDRVAWWLPGIRVPVRGTAGRLASCRLRSTSSTQCFRWPRRSRWTSSSEARSATSGLCRASCRRCPSERSPVTWDGRSSGPRRFFP